MRKKVIILLLIIIAILLYRQFNKIEYKSDDIYIECLYGDEDAIKLTEIDVKQVLDILNEAKWVSNNQTKCMPDYVIDLSNDRIYFSKASNTINDRENNRYAYLTAGQGAYIESLIEKAPIQYNSNSIRVEYQLEDRDDIELTEIDVKQVLDILNEVKWVSNNQTKCMPTHIIVLSDATLYFSNVTYTINDRINNRYVKLTKDQVALIETLIEKQID